MSRQDKATTERNTKMLREFVKRPENKTCCDCKRNGEHRLKLISHSIRIQYLIVHCIADPRWASWNLYVPVLYNIYRMLMRHKCARGVYLCIRCSGIHRSMGTHISKVKSIDLDTWTPEQMQVGHPFPLPSMRVNSS